MKTSSLTLGKQSILNYYRQLILSFYLAWYIYIVVLYFDPSVEIWLNALIIAVVVGIALNLSANKSKSLWLSLRLFIIPFAVSSYTALIRGKDFFVIFPSNMKVTFLGILVCLAFAFVYYLLLRKGKLIPHKD